MITSNELKDNINGEYYDPKTRGVYDFKET